MNFKYSSSSKTAPLLEIGTGQSLGSPPGWDPHALGLLGLPRSPSLSREVQGALTLLKAWFCSPALCLSAPMETRRSNNREGVGTEQQLQISCECSRAFARVTLLLSQEHKSWISSHFNYQGLQLAFKGFFWGRQKIPNRNVW